MQQNDITKLFYEKFNILIDDSSLISGISAYQIVKINVHHINNIFKLTKLYIDNDILCYLISIKLYFVFGYERSLNILKGSFGLIGRVFLERIENIDVTDIDFIQEGSKYLPNINRRFINFMFERPSKNHFIDMLNDKNGLLYKNFDYVYNHFKELNASSKHVSMKQIIKVLDGLKNDFRKELIPPNCYRLYDDEILKDIILGNNTIYDAKQILKEVCLIYTKMQRRVEASIPYVCGLVDNLSYEMMKLDDPIFFTLGYQTSCCFRTLYIAHEHLLYASLCRNGRILLIREGKKVLAFASLKRNGNVLIVNSIEYDKTKYSDYQDKIIRAFNVAIWDIIKTCNESSEPLKVVVIGRDSSLKPKTTLWPNDIKTPTIYEHDDDTYQYTDIYHLSVEIIYKDPNFDLRDIYAKNPSVSFQDPLDTIKWKLKDELDSDTLNIIKGIDYESNRTFTDVSNIDSICYCKYFYLILKDNKLIFSNSLNYDERYVKMYLYLKNYLENLSVKTLKLII